jgi:hypothetical protein
MGLDIYLSSKAEQAAIDGYYNIWNGAWDRKESGAITEEEFERLVEPLEYPGHSDEASPRYPDHLFNRRYLRSSYNSSGFNRAVPDFLAKEDEGSLYWIFEPLGREWDGDEGTLTADDIPALEDARARAQHVVAELSVCDPLRAEAIHPPPIGGAAHLWQKLPSEDEVMVWARERLSGVPHSSFESYSDGKGTVFTQGFEILAITLGEMFRQPTPIIVYRVDREALESYIQSAEIVVEFIDEAIELIKRDGEAHISWSG